MITLKDILRNKRKEVEKDKRQESVRQLKKKIDLSIPRRDFLGKISNQGTNIIAETKTSSPSMKGKTRRDAIDLAREYNSCEDVAAVSVLTERKHFGGSNLLALKIRAQTFKPILRKDFVIDEYQIYQSRVYGADAILLISSILSASQIEAFVELSRELGMEPLVEFNTIEDRNKIPDSVKIYGRNYRRLDSNLEKPTFDDINGPSLIEDLPYDIIKVAESHISTRGDMSVLSQKGFDAFLIGTAIATAENVSDKIAELVL